MSITELTFSRLTHHSFSEHYATFKDLYLKLYREDDLSHFDQTKILSLIVLCANQTDVIMRNLAYRMALAFGNKTNDFTPLYDLSINLGLMPVANLIRSIEELPINEEENDEGFISNIVASYIDHFKNNEITLTEQQYKLNLFSDENLDSSTIVVAPTSYGKSELIISAIKASPNKKICILVPSKSLLSQTRKRVLDANIDWVGRIVVHPEMHKRSDTDAVYVLTQERLSRILTGDRGASFDMVFVDEAHNLLEKDERNSLLASAIYILRHRNPNTAFKYLTPFLKDMSNIKIRGDENEKRGFRVEEYVKSESIYISDFRSEPATFCFYDHFTNTHLPIGEGSDNQINYLLSHAASKNIVYLNRPIHIQNFAKELAENLPPIESEDIDSAIEEITENTNENYLLVECMRRGVLYHHGSISDSIRSYSEYLYRNVPEIKYMITNSTLLEGVNLPAEKLFLLSIGKGLGNLRPAQFKNLAGRINRFSDVFVNPDAMSLKKLQPEIHIIGNSDFMRDDARIDKFAENVMRVTKKIKDEVENVLLESVEINDKNEVLYDKTITRLENIEEGCTNMHECQRASTAVGIKLLENNISEIDVFSSEDEMQDVIDRIQGEIGTINDSNTLMRVIFDAFVDFIDPQNTRQKNSLLRLRSNKAQTFYAMFLDWNIEKYTLPMMIRRFIDYWEGLEDETLVYVAGWGDTAKDGGFNKVFTRMMEKTLSEKINLAIVRIKEEEDFFDYVVFRFVEILNELELIDENFYKLCKYGTVKPEIILLIKNGFTRGFSQLMHDNYTDLIEFSENDKVNVSPEIHQRLFDDGVGFMQRYEAVLNIPGAI